MASLAGPAHASRIFSSAASQAASAGLAFASPWQPKRLGRVLEELGSPVLPARLAIFLALRARFRETAVLSPTRRRRRPSRRASMAACSDGRWPRPPKRTPVQRFRWRNRRHVLAALGHAAAHMDQSKVFSRRRAAAVMSSIAASHSGDLASASSASGASSAGLGPHLEHALAIFLDALAHFFQS